MARAIRLYEQEPEEAFVSTRFELYVRRWLRWVGAGLSERSMKRKVRVNKLWNELLQDSCLGNGPPTSPQDIDSYI